jgi:phosphatidylglycerol lysyltransferase
VERGFAMGYFSEEYLQQCNIMVVRDAAGTIQAFLNQVPADFDSQEATYDLLRHVNTSVSNINDYLLMQFIGYLEKEHYSKLNLGLCPLAGLDEADETQKSFLDNVLRFAYANGDRIYSFSGLYRFKSKYEPEWSDRYIAYQGGVRNFSRTMTALTRAMRVRSKK